MAHVGKRPRGDTSLLKDRDSRDATRRPATVPAKIRHAAELLCAQPSTLDYGELAVKVGYPNARQLRRALALPQSVKFLRDYRREMVEHIRLRNPEALREIRDTRDNSMAQVQAIRTLESMGEEADRQNGSRAGQVAPGVTIIIASAQGHVKRTVGPPQPQVIEHDELDEDLAD
jgi:hypothetical protein